MCRHRLTLLCGKEPQLVRRARIVRVALSIVAVLEDHTKAIELLHEYLNDYRLSVMAPLWGIRSTDFQFAGLKICFPRLSLHQCRETLVRQACNMTSQRSIVA